MGVTKQQLDILQHTIGADEFGRRKVDRNHFVTDADFSDGIACEQLVVLGLMESFGQQKLAGGMTYYRATDAGRKAVADQSPKPPPEPKRSRSQKRWLAFLNEDSGLTFHEWLRDQKHRPKEYRH